jgi:hypothetical protein
MVDLNAPSAPSVALRRAVPERASGAAMLRVAVKPSALLACALYVVGACVFFRQQIFSGFDLYFGNRGDARLILFVHEHVYRTLLGQSSFLSPPEFYNLKNTLGGSDAFVLNQLVYPRCACSAPTLTSRL